MPRSSSHIIALLLAALLSACQSLPEPEPEPMFAPEAVIETVSVGSPETSASQPIAEPEPVPVDLDQLAYEQAIAALKSGAAEQALTLLNRLSQDAPDKPRLFTNLGLAHFQLQQAKLAEQAFQQAIERNPNDAVAHNHLGILQRRQGRFQDALVEYQRAIKIDSKYAGAHMNLGILFDLYFQDLEKALQQYRKYLDLTSEENAQVAGWIIDIERRLKTSTTQQKG
jgi:tetratricopeptide (TPR) repeat protein